MLLDIVQAIFSLCYTSVLCSTLNDPNNGVINCAYGDDEVPSYEDICSFTCNTGYELTGSDTWTCQSDGSWSGTITNDVCRTGTTYVIVVFCRYHIILQFRVQHLMDLIME